MAKNNTVHKKLEIARKELLDLGLRNPLLNYRITKARGLELSGELPADVFNILVNLKHKMTFDESLQRDEAERTDSGKAISLDKPENSPEREIVTFPPAVGKHGDSKLQTNYSRKQLEQRLLNTYHSARTYIEEQGVNVLYIAFGMLHWFESENSTELRRAPLILAPVQLERISAKDRFSIAYTEDEIGPNISLAAKIKSDFGLDLPDFPEDTELNLDEYFLQVQFAVNGLKGWTVDANSIVIGFFSFGKFLMYRDLDSTVWPDYTALDEHAILAALLDGGFKEADSSITEDELLDEVLPLPETKHVLDADSSQMLAVMDVKQGRNLVIQGPPGTGKSQTITNMIAEAIGEGKKVLFVSEKMAALEVVKRRLDTVGLGVACLELHSHKTNKKLLLRELAATLELGKPIYRDNGSLEMLEELRQRLNNYCIAVNTQVGNSEVTPYQAMGELLRYGKDYPVIGFNTMEQWSAAEYFKREAMVQELEQWIKANGLLAKHPFWGSKKKVVLPTEIKDIREAASKVGDIAEKLIDLLKSGAASLHFPLPLNTQNTLEVISVLKLVCEAPKLEGVNLHSEHWLDKIPQIQMSVAAGLSYNTVHESYDAVLISEAWKQDVLQTRQILMSYKAKWWKLLSGEYRRAKRAALGWLSNPGRKSVSLTELADAILESQRSKEIMQKFKPLVMELFPSYWNEEHTDWGKVASVTEWMNGTLRELKNGSLPAWLSALLEMGFEKDQLKSFIIDLEHQESEYTRALLVIKELLELDVTISNGRVLRLSEADYQQVKEIVSQWAVYTPRLQEIAAYNHLESACLQEGLEPLIKFAQDWADAAENLVDAFRWNWFQAISTSAFYDRDALSAFESSRHEQAVRKFVELDLQFIKTNRIRLAEGHWAKLPQYEAGGQLGVLRRELEKKSRHLPIRQLMAKAGQAIQAIKPVFMMGPLSISTYLEPGGLTFDLVIFDEASQVKPVDAFGAIVRAKQAVVVGDSKQMPPTDLFNSFLNKEDEEDEDNYVADVESILGLFVGQGAPQRMLRWHYRSRHESLITVSNHEFYDNKLVIFPSPDADKQTSGLKYHYLPHTFYDRGRTRTNKLEAAEVAEAVIRHARMHPDLTLGVAAFSIVQMQAIMDELEMLRRINPDTEAFFSAHEHEPFFVKNLENVQGDERDVIYISIGYGKTSDGYLAMEFGVNREGGERRLNVLITRARIRCEVFTNLRSDDIDLNRSNAKGVKVLKTF